LVADLAEGHRQCVISNSTRPAASGSAGGLASPGTSRAAGIPSRVVSASRTAASRRVSSSVTRAWGSGSRWRSTASCSSADLGGATPGTCSLNVAATAALKLGSPRSSWARWIFSVSSWTLRLSPSCGAATEVSASLIIGARRRKSATWVRCCSISPATSALPAAKVTGSTWRSSTVSPLPLKSRPIPLNGALITLTSAFRTATQMASPRPARSWLSSPESGTLTLMLLSESVMSATPAGSRHRPRRARPAPRGPRPAGAGGRGASDLDEHLHDGAAAQRFLHSLLERLERNAPTHQRSDRHGTRRDQADRLLPVPASVETTAVHDELTGEHLIEVHRHGLGVDRDDADGSPDADHIRDGPGGGRVTGDLEGDVDAGGARPLIGPSDDIRVRAH